VPINKTTGDIKIPERVGAGNAVRIGDSAATVTGYETSIGHLLLKRAREGEAVGLKPEVRISADV